MGRGFTFTAGLWAVPLLPDVIREAVFSGTVLADLVDESGTNLTTDNPGISVMVPAAERAVLKVHIREVIGAESRVTWILGGDVGDGDLTVLEHGDSLAAANDIQVAQANVAATMSNPDCEDTRAGSLNR